MRWGGMPRFYFHLFDDVASRDVDGVELPDLAAAEALALAGARDLACEAIRKGRLNLAHRVEVADEAGATLLNIAFRDTFTIEG